LPQAVMASISRAMQNTHSFFIENTPFIGRAEHRLCRF
jgi:hypothetical protein